MFPLERQMLCRPYREAAVLKAVFDAAAHHVAYWRATDVRFQYLAEDASMLRTSMPVSWLAVYMELLRRSIKSEVG